MFADYPKWIPVNGPGHPESPGRVLVNNEDEEREAKASGTGPAALNPPPAAGQKTIEDMDRDELKQTLVAEGISDSMSDDDIRSAIREGRERRAQHAQEDADHEREQRDTREAGGDRGDGQQTDKVADADAKAPKDAKGDEIAPDPADEANKGQPGETRTAPAAASAPATDVRSDEAKKKEADDKPAGNVTEQAATPPDHRRGSRTRRAD